MRELKDERACPTAGYIEGIAEAMPIIASHGLPLDDLAFRTEDGNLTGRIHVEQLQRIDQSEHITCRGRRIGSRRSLGSESCASDPGSRSPANCEPG
jgi:hypothetical protein